MLGRGAPAELKDAHIRLPGVDYPSFRYDGRDEAD